MTNSSAEMRQRAETLGAEPTLQAMVKAKAKRRASDELEKPLSQYRDEELAKMRVNFYGANPSYHIARYNFVHKIGKSRTGITIARPPRPPAAGAQEGCPSRNKPTKSSRGWSAAGFFSPQRHRDTETQRTKRQSVPSFPRRREPRQVKRAASRGSRFRGNDDL